MKKFLLLTLGPVNVAGNVRLAVCKDDICHRETDFSDLLQSIENKLLRLFEIRNVSDYRAVVITGSGTASNEAILSSVVGNKKILILSNGEFGERLHHISAIHNKNTFLLEIPWGNVLDLGKVEAYLQNHEVDILMMVHHETSSGMLNSLADIGALCFRYGTMFIVDGVSSVGAEVIDMEKHHITFCSGSSSKAVASYPGLSFVVGRTSALENLKNMPQQSTYLNLYRYYQFIKNISQTPNTPAVPLFYALEQALDNILLEGLAHRCVDLKYKAKFLRQGMSNLGLKFLIGQRDMCSVLTTVLIPSHIDLGIFRQKLREKSIIIYEGKGCLNGRVFQVGNIGELSLDDLQFFLDALGEVLLSFDRLSTGIIGTIIKPVPTFLKECLEGEDQEAPATA
ncbi:MAG: aminotransferase class V-fold PLP-dependent enzyme [Nitrospira sp.]